MSIYPAPLNPTFPIFNINNFYQQGKNLSNYGDQTLLGTLTTSGEVTTGNEIIYGDSTTQKEPLVLTISDKNQLIDANLVTKRYVDDEINTVVASIQQQSPQVFTYGKAANVVSYLPHNNGTVYINFDDTTLTVQTVYFQVFYHIARSGANTILQSTSIPSQYYYAVYQATFYKQNGAFAICKFSLQDGDVLTNQNTMFSQNYQPIN